MRLFPSFSFGFALLAIVFASGQAQASFSYCNDTKNAIEAALGYRDGTKWVSEGWWQIQPGQCARVFNKPLNQRFYFYFAQDLTPTTPPPIASPGHTISAWRGKYAFCIDKKAFRFSGDTRCEDKNMHTEGFREVDVGAHPRDYVLRFQ